MRVAILLLLFATPGRGIDWLEGPLLVDARRLLEAGDFAAARQGLEALVATHPEEVRARYALVQCLIELAELDHVQSTAEGALRDHPGSGYAHAAVGDAHLHLGDFDGAASAYQAGLGVEPGVAAAHYGLGVLHRAERRMRTARVELETAYRIDPTDSRILLAMASVTARSTRRLDLLREGIERALGLEPEERRAFEGRLEVLSLLDEDRRQCRLARPAGRYEVPLRRLRSGPQSGARLGLGVVANGGKKVVALLDSGASGVTLSERYARKLGLERLGASAVRGLGDEGLRETTLARLRTLELGGVLFEDCLVDVVASRHLSEDAVVGLDVLAADFEITLDFGGGEIRLEALPPLVAASGGSPDPYDYERSLEKLASGYLPVRIFGGDVLVPVTVNGIELSHFLLDSGATDTVLAQRLGRKVVRLVPSNKQARGLSGRIGTVQQATDVQLRIGNFARRQRNLLAIDLDGYASRVGYGIGGLLGYSLLADAVVVLDYRNAVVRFDLTSPRRSKRR